jgi:hypothetical protein
MPFCFNRKFTPYMRAGVRHPLLPLVYHATRRTPPGPLPVRVVHSRSSLFMQVSGIIRTGYPIYGGRGQTSPTTPGIPCPAPHSRPGGAFREPPAPLPPSFIAYCFINLINLTGSSKNTTFFTMLNAEPAQPTAALAGFTPQTHRQFRAAELTTDPVHGSRFTVHGSRFTVHGSRFTVHGSRFTVHGSHYTLIQGQRV